MHSRVAVRSSWLLWLLEDSTCKYCNTEYLYVVCERVAHGHTFTYHIQEAAPGRWLAQTNKVVLRPCHIAALCIAQAKDIVHQWLNIFAVRYDNVLLRASRGIINTTVAAIILVATAGSQCDMLDSIPGESVSIGRKA